MIPFDINVSTVSWIDKKIMAVFSDMPNPFGKEAWLDMLCYGMYHTANPAPPEVFHGQKYKSGTTLDKKYRSLTNYTIQLQVGEDGKFQSVRRLPGSDAILDAGYTPPFDSSWELWKGIIGTAVVGVDPTLPSKMHSEATTYSPGEKGSLSQIVLPGPQWQTSGITPLSYSSIKVNQGEVILGHSMIKFRAGTQGDYIGVVGMGTPNHVPWVWCESILTYKDNAGLVIYGAGSAFPCHAFYVGDEQQGRLDLSTDRAKLRSVFSSGLAATVNWAPVPLPSNPRSVIIGISPQAPTSETTKSGQIVTGQAYTAPANDNSVRRVIKLAGLKCWET
jgi:hypothetical protein